MNRETVESFEVLLVCVCLMSQSGCSFSCNYSKKKIISVLRQKLVSYNVLFTLKLQYHTSCDPLTKKQHTNLLLYLHN